MNIQSEFNNLNYYLQEACKEFGGRLITSSKQKLIYIMPLYTFGKHMGDNYFEFEAKNDEYVLSFISKKRNRALIRTTLTGITKDYTLEEWHEYIEDILKSHMQKPEYLKFASGDFDKEMERQLTGKGKGCLVPLLFFILFSTLIFISI